MRFRKDEVTVASKIESMFNRVACREDDTDALRFLWWTASLDEPLSDYKMTVHLFGKADSLCIAAWGLQRTAADNEAAFGEEIRIGWRRHESWRWYCRGPYCIRFQIAYDCPTKAQCSLTANCRLSSETITCGTKSHPCTPEGDVLDT